MTLQRAPTSWRAGRRTGNSGPERGFTLLEVLLTLVVLGISIVGISQGFAVGLRSSAIARDTTTATAFARAKLAEVDAGVLPVSQDAQGTFESLGAPDVTWTLNSRTTQYPGLYEVVLKVQWSDRGATRDLSVVRWMLDRQAGAIAALQAGSASAPVKPKTSGTPGGATR
jgi:prepilin-type N-terminal cleavage/methylation domain-containing protein